METFRQAQPRRQPYETGMNMSNLPEECLEDMSAPNFDLSLPSQMSDLRGELLANVSAPNMCDVSKTTSHVDNVYGEILDRFKSIRERINRSNQLHGSEDPCYQQVTICFIPYPDLERFSIIYLIHRPRVAGSTPTVIQVVISLATLMRRLFRIPPPWIARPQVRVVNRDVVLTSPYPIDRRT